MVDWNKFTTEQIIEKFPEMSLAIAAEAQKHMMSRPQEAWEKFVDSNADNKFIENLSQNNKIADYLNTVGNDVKTAENISHLIGGMNEGGYNYDKFPELAEKLATIKIDASINNPKEYAETSWARQDRENLEIGKVEFLDKKLEKMSLEQIGNLYGKLEAADDGWEVQNEILDYLKKVPQQKLQDFTNASAHNVENMYWVEKMLDKDNPQHKESLDSIKGFKEEISSSAYYKKTRWYTDDKAAEAWEKKQAQEKSEQEAAEKKHREEQKLKEQEEKRLEERKKEEQKQKDFENKKTGAIEKEFNYSQYEKKFAIDIARGKNPSQSFDEYMKQMGSKNTVQFGAGQTGHAVMMENPQFTAWKKQKGYDNPDSDASKKLDFNLKNSLRTETDMKISQQKNKEIQISGGR